MKIVIINEFVKMGGAEIQTFRERDLFLANGHSVTVLTFDCSFPACESKEWINIPIKIENKAKRWVDKLWGLKAVQQQIASVLSKIDPDFIHINGVFCAPLDVMECVKKYKAIQTIRDYAAVCPYGTCTNERDEECKGIANTNCFECGRFNIRCFYNYLSLKALNKKRREYLDAIITPSQALAQKCWENGLYAKCINNPFDFSKIRYIGPKISVGTKKYLYYGLISENKGIKQLTSAFETFAERCDVELILVGKVYAQFQEQFDIIKNRKHITYLGQKEYDEIMNLYQNIYCVVVPSLWIENYPNTVLEALANKTLVIGSNRGGIPEMIQDERMVFDILDKGDIISKLEYTYTMSDEEYKETTENNYKRVFENNTPEKYYDRMMLLIKNI